MLIAVLGPAAAVQAEAVNPAVGSNNTRGLEPASQRVADHTSSNQTDWASPRMPGCDCIVEKEDFWISCRYCSNGVCCSFSNYVIILGTFGITLTIVVITLLFVYICWKIRKVFLQGRRRKSIMKEERKEEEEEQAEMVKEGSLHYASLQNLQSLSRSSCHDSEDKTCYASVAELCREEDIQPEQSTDLLLQESQAP